MKNFSDIFAILFLSFFPFHRNEGVSPDHFVSSFDKCLCFLELLEDIEDHFLLKLNSKYIIGNLVLSYLCDVSLYDNRSVFFEPMPSLISVLYQISFLLIVLWIFFFKDQQVLTIIFAKNWPLEAFLLVLMDSEPPSKCCIGFYMVNFIFNRC